MTPSPTPVRPHARIALVAVLLAAATVLAAGPGATPGGAAEASSATGTGPAGQTLTVTPVTGLDPDGADLTVTGTGFTGAAGFDVATAGLYVALCVDNGVGQTPTPCVGGVDLSGTGSSSAWVTNNPLPGVPASAVTPMAADGSFTVSIRVEAADQFVDCAALPAGKQCKVFTRLDHRQSGNRSQDVRVPVTFGGPAPVGPSVSLSPATGLDPAGTDVTVTGSGFPTEPPGVYVVYGPAPANSTDATPYGALTFVPSSQISAMGSFTTTLTDVRAVYTGADGVDRDFTDGGGRISTFRAHGTPDPQGRWATSTPVSFRSAAVPATTTTLAASAPSVAAGSPVVLTAAVATASGPVRAGTVELRAGATALGSAPLGADGRATRSVTFPSPGPRTVTAHFTGTAEAAPSVSAGVSVTVTGAPTPPPSTDPPPPPADRGPSGTRTGTGPGGQTLTVTPVDDLAPTGTEVEVVGAGYDAGAGFDLAVGGMYVALCVDKGPAVAPSPCVGGVDTEGSSGSSRWVTNNPYEGVPAEAVVPIAPDGSFRTTITVESSDELVDCLALPAGERCVVATRSDHRASADRSQDVKVPVCFAGEVACTTDPILPGDPSAAEAFTGFELDGAGVAADLDGAGPSALGDGYPALDGGVAPGPGLPLAVTGGGLAPLPLALLLLAAGAGCVALARRRHRSGPAVAAVVPAGRGR